MYWKTLENAKAPANYIRVVCPAGHATVIWMHKRQLGHLERDVLEQLSAGDLLYGFLLSAHSTGRMFRLARERAAQRHRQKRAVERLITKGYIRTRGKQLSITNAGRLILEASVRSTRNLLETAQWDGKWRIVVFDIPETHAHLRRKIRSILKRAGFIKMQQSVWVFPHDCEELAALLKKESQLSHRVLYGVLERIENASALKAAFKL